MRISVIIPALDERGVIGAAIDGACDGHTHEIVVVDGGSVDDTAAVAEQHGARVIATEAGRARQMNAGAAVTTGDVLLFLHADTILPGAYATHVAAVLARPGVVAGAFALAIDAPHRALRQVRHFHRKYKNKECDESENADHQRIHVIEFLVPIQDRSPECAWIGLVRAARAGII